MKICAHLIWLLIWAFLYSQRYECVQWCDVVQSLDCCVVGLLERLRPRCYSSSQSKDEYNNYSLVLATLLVLHYYRFTVSFDDRNRRWNDLRGVFQRWKNKINTWRSVKTMRELVQLTLRNQIRQRSEKLRSHWVFVKHMKQWYHRSSPIQHIIPLSVLS